MESGVYVLKFGHCGMVYVGAALDVRGRILQHKFQLGAGSHKLRRVQAAWDEDRGVSLSVAFRVCGNGDVGELQELERRLIDHWVKRVGWNRMLNSSARPFAIKRKWRGKGSIERNVTDQV